MLYIMYNMAQSPPGGIRRDLSGDPRKADEGTRTPDLLITSELLYQLSYVGATAGSLEGASGPDKRRIRPTNHPYWTRRLPVSYTHLRAHETKANLVCRLLLEKKKKTINNDQIYLYEKKIIKTEQTKRTRK